MKHFILYFVISFTFINTSFANKFELTPIMINFKGVEAKNDTIVAYGDFGSILISHDNALNWKQVKVFDRGVIIKYYLNDDKMIAFNNTGDIGISIDKGLNWNTAVRFEDTILAVTQYTDGYFLRTRSKIFSIDSEFKIIKEFNLYSPELIPINNGYIKKPDYHKSIIFFKNRLIVEIDSSCIIRFDTNLVPLDTFSFSKAGLFNSTLKYRTGYGLDMDSNYLYIKLLYFNKSNALALSVFRTKDFKTAVKFYDFANPFSIYRIINEKFYSLSLTEKYLIDSTRLTNNRNFLLNINDLIVVNNKQMIVGDNKLIEILDLKDSSLNVISECTAISGALAPDIIGDSQYLFYSGGDREIYPYIYRTDNDCATFKPTINTKDNQYNTQIPNFRSRFKFLDETDNSLYLGGYFYDSGPTNVLVSKDFGQTFITKESDFYFGSMMSIFVLRNGSFPRNLQRNNGNYIMADGHQFYKGIFYSSIRTFNNNFKTISSCYDSNLVIDYIHSRDTNTFLVHCANAIDSTSEIRYTINKMKNWELIKKYPISESVNSYKEIIVNNKKFVVFVHYNTVEYTKNHDSSRIVLLDVVNLEDNKFDRLFEWKSRTVDSTFAIYGVGIDSDSNKAYIAFQDTLFVISDIYNRTKWQYYTLPTKGSRMVLPIKKFGDRFYARYTDENFLWNSNNNMFWIKPLDSLPVSVDDETANSNYLFSNPPYPIPISGALVRSLIYWDMSLDIDKDEIGVYNLNGERVSGRDKITIEKINGYSGYLLWDCTNFENGTYLIQIKHGTRSSTLKIIINR